jgi:hypothetical protein
MSGYSKNSIKEILEVIEQTDSETIKQVLQFAEKE